MAASDDGAPACSAAPWPAGSIRGGSQAANLFLEYAPTCSGEFHPVIARARFPRPASTGIRGKWLI